MTNETPCSFVEHRRCT